MAAQLPLHRFSRCGRRLSLRLAVLLAFFPLILGHPALLHATFDCGQAGECVPIVTGLNATATSIIVGWYTPGMTPDSIELREGGTDQQSYKDGKTLASFPHPTFAQNADSLTARGLTPNTPYDQLHVCAVFDSLHLGTFCTQPFTVKTLSQGSVDDTHPDPVIVDASAGDTWIDLRWTAFGHVYKKYFINYQVKAADGAPPNPVTNATEPDDGDWGGHKIEGLQPGTTYQLSVQGCNYTGGFDDTCFGWGPVYEASTLPRANAADRPIPSITTSDAGDTWIQVTWNTTPRFPYNNYNIRYRVKTALNQTPVPFTTAVENGASSSHRVDSLKPGTMYEFEVQGCPGQYVDCGAWSPEYDTTTRTPTPAAQLQPAVLNPAQGSVVAGNTLKLDGQYFPFNGGPVTLTWEGRSGDDGPHLGGSFATATISGQGTFSTTVTIPADLAPGVGSTTGQGRLTIHAVAANAKADATVQVLARSQGRTLTVTSFGAHEGTSITVGYPGYTLTGNNFAPLFQVTIHVDSTDGPSLGTVTAAADGTITMSLLVTADQIGNRYGDHKLVAETNGFNLAERTYTFVQDTGGAH